MTLYVSPLKVHCNCTSFCDLLIAFTHPHPTDTSIVLFIVECC